MQNQVRRSLAVRFDRLMSITLETPTPSSLDEVAEAVAAWQHDGAPVQLHPGDLGWHWRLGAEDLAGSVRLWRYDGRILAVGVVDSSGLIRMAIAPKADQTITSHPSSWPICAIQPVEFSRPAPRSSRPGSALCSASS